MRERERGAGRRGDVQGGQSDEEGKQEVAGRRGHGRLWRGHAAAPTGRSLKKLLAVGLGRLLAGPACWATGPGQAAQGGKRQVSLFSLLFFFSIFLTFVLI